MTFSNTDVGYVLQKRFLWWWRDLTFPQGNMYDMSNLVVEECKLPHIKYFKSIEDTKDAAKWLSLGYPMQVIFDKCEGTMLLGFPFENSDTTYKYGLCFTQAYNRYKDIEYSDLTKKRKDIVESKIISF